MNKVLLGPLLFTPLLACAATPSFDCAKAAGAAETLICKDAALAALDNELATLYPKALANLSRTAQNGKGHAARLDQGSQRLLEGQGICANAWRRTTSSGSLSCR